MYKHAFSKEKGIALNSASKKLLAQKRPRTTMLSKALGFLDGVAVALGRSGQAGEFYLRMCWEAVSGCMGGLGS